MTKPELFDYIANRFSADPDYPWEGDQTDCVFRHGNNKKWFALYMEVERKRLGLEGSGAASILNVKTGPLILPAYHMNKTNWVSIILDAIDQKTFEELLDISWELTK